MNQVVGFPLGHSWHVLMTCEYVNGAPEALDTVGGPVSSLGMSPEDVEAAIEACGEPVCEAVCFCACGM